MGYYQAIRKVDQRIVHRDPLGIGYVHGRRPDDPIAQDVGQGDLVDHLATRRIDQHGGRLHRGQRPGVDEVSRLRCQVDVERDEVTPRQQLIERHERRPQRHRHRVRQLRHVVVQDRHPEPGRPACHRLADPAEADDPDRRAVDVRP